MRGKKHTNWIHLLISPLAAAAVATSGCAVDLDTPDRIPETAESDDPEEGGRLGDTIEDDVAEPIALPEPIARPDLRPGDIAVSARGLELIVPEPGETGHATTMYADDHAEEMVIETREDGTVVEHTMEAIEFYASGGPACSDGAFATFNHRWRRQLGWTIHRGSIPGKYNKKAFVAAIRKGASNITNSRNNCGMNDFVSASQVYLGTTTRRANISGKRCTSRNKQSTVDFGYLPGAAIATACIWSGAKGSLEADIRFDSSVNWFATAKVPKGCKNRFDVESVSTHEFGHAFGVGHVSENGHRHLTMSTMTSPCNVGARTLGRGDVRALRAKY